jgi:hypothetical protein
MRTGADDSDEEVVDDWKLEDREDLMGNWARRRAASEKRLVNPRRRQMAWSARAYHRPPSLGKQAAMAPSQRSTISNSDADADEDGDAKGDAGEGVEDEAEVDVFGADADADADTGACMSGSQGSEWRGVRGWLRERR